MKSPAEFVIRRLIDVRNGLSLILLFATLIRSATSWHVASRDSLKPSCDYGRRLRRESRTKADMRVTPPVRPRVAYIHMYAHSRVCA